MKPFFSTAQHGGGQPPKRRRLGSALVQENDIPWLRAREIEKLIRLRYRGPLPADDDGVDWLYLIFSHLVRCRNGASKARDFTAQWAPWFNDADREVMLAELRTDPVYFTARAFGERTNLTLAERDQLDIRTFRAADITDEEWEEIKKARHAQGEMARRAKKAALKNDTKSRTRKRVAGVLNREDLSSRARELFNRLKPKQWISVPDIARAWTEGDIGAQKIKSRRTTVARLVKELRAALLIEVREERTRNGRPVIVVQRIADERLTVAHAGFVATSLRQAAERGSEPPANVGATTPDTEATSKASHCDNEIVRHTEDYCDTEPCAMSPKGLYGAREWTQALRPDLTNVTLSVPDTLSGGAPEGAPTSVVEQADYSASVASTFCEEAAREGDSASETGAPTVPLDDTPLAEPEPNPAVVDILTPRASRRARAEKPSTITFDPMTGSWLDDTGPGPRSADHQDDEPAHDEKPRAKSWFDVAEELNSRDRACAL